jgi:acetylornithine deacetylase/succinyl-diaminopimelate desuccinylase-like protein
LDFNVNRDVQEAGIHSRESQRLGARSARIGRRSDRPLRRRPHTIEEANAHRAGERVPLADLYKATQVVGLTLADLPGG